MKQAAIGFLLFVAGVSGAWVSRLVRGGTLSVWWTLAVGQLALVAWAIQTKDDSHSLVVAAVLFDVVYSLAWFATYYALGEPFTIRQIIGCALLIAGLVLVNS